MVACKARGSRFDSSSYKMVFLLSPRHKEVGKMDPDMINCVILHIHGHPLSMDPGPPTQLRTQNSFFLSGPAEGSADDAIALSAMASYKTQNPFGFVLEDLSEDPEIHKYI